MKKVRCWFSALARVTALAMIGFAVASCSGEPRNPATSAQMDALPFMVDIRQPFEPYNAGTWKLVLFADGVAGAVTPTIEIEVHNVLKSGEFPPESMLVENWSDLKSYSNLQTDPPIWGELARKPAIQISGVITDRDGDKVRLEQRVAKLPKGYARILAFAEADRFQELKPTIDAITSSLYVKK